MGMAGTGCVPQPPISSVPAPASAVRVIDIAMYLCTPSPPEDLLNARVRSSAGTGQTEEAERLGRGLLREGPAPVCGGATTARIPR
jgi:hypothetical protein